MQKIVSYINLFTANQPIYYFNGIDTPQLVASVPVDMVGNTVSQLCFKYNTNKAHFFGQENFIDKIVEDAKDMYMTQYSEHELEVEVN